MRLRLKFFGCFSLNFCRLRAWKEMTSANFRRSYFTQYHISPLLSIGPGYLSQLNKVCVRHVKSAANVKIKLYSRKNKYLGEVLRTDAIQRAWDEGLVLMSIKSPAGAEIKSFKLVTPEEKAAEKKVRKNIKEFIMKVRSSPADLERKIEQMKELLEKGKSIRLEIDPGKQFVSEEHQQEHAKKVNELMQKVNASLKDYITVGKAQKNPEEYEPKQQRVWNFTPKKQDES